MIRPTRFFLSLFFLIPALNTFPQPVGEKSASELRLALKKLNTLGSVLYIAAHPDDENTRLLSFLANEKNFRTVYLSLTRGDGGQNLVGKEQGDELGLIRTRELMEARKIDGAEQTFTRCTDFGYSKSPEETLRMWDRDKALADVVWAIRKYQPDVIICRFPTTGEGGHGHHTASAILALEAFKISGDKNVFPEQLAYVKPWRARRIFQNSFTPRNQPTPDYTGQIRVDVGRYNPLLGKSYGEIASESRSMHKSQGFGVAAQRGSVFEYFKKLDGDTSVADLFENIDTSWKRTRQGNLIDSLLTKAYREFDDDNPQKTVASLLRIRKLIQNCGDDYWSRVKDEELMQLVASCLGLWFETTAKTFSASPGDSVYLTFSAVPGLTDDLRLSGIRVAGFDTTFSGKIEKNGMFSIQKGIILPVNTRFSNPYWLNEPVVHNMYTVARQALIGLAWNQPELTTMFQFVISGDTLTYQTPIRYKWTDPVKGEKYRPFEVVPPVSVLVDDDVIFFPDQKSKTVTVRVKSQSDPVKGKLRMQIPSGWSVTPSIMDVVSSGNNFEVTGVFTVTPPVGKEISNTNSTAGFVFESDDGFFNQSIIQIEHDHIPAITYLKNCKVRLVTSDFRTVVKKVGYIVGAGDDIPRCLCQAGIDVNLINPSEIKLDILSKYQTVITGIRAFNTLENSEAYLPELMKYVENGGNLLVQYNTNNFIGSVKGNIGPYPFTISRDRVTQEDATPSFINPAHPLLNFPNRITDADFEGWVQERGLYFASEMAPEYEKIISWADDGEKPLDGGLIYCRYGRGTFIYTGISFFRQLPAGNPGAYRLFANLINAGQSSKKK